MGSKREKSPGRWELRVFVGRDPITDRPVYRSRIFKGGERAASKALSAFEVELMATEQVGTNRSVGWLLDTWLKVQTPLISPATLRTYRGYIEKWLRPRFGTLPIPDLTTGHLRELDAAMVAEGRAASTRHQVHSILRGALTYAVEREWHDRNVAAMRKAPSAGQRSVVAPSTDELLALLHGSGEVGSDLWTFIALAAALGRRAGQLCAIRWSHVDFDEMVIHLEPTRKSPEPVALPFDQSVAQVIEARMGYQTARFERVQGTSPQGWDPYLLSFWSDGSKAPATSSFTHAFARVRDSLGLPHLHPHTLRHFAATYMLDKGLPLPAVAERLGHASPAVTARIYSHAMTGRDREAAKVLGGAIVGALPQPDAKKPPARSRRT